MGPILLSRARINVAGFRAARTRLTRMGRIGLLAALLAGCAGGGLETIGVTEPEQAKPTQSAGNETIGNGAVKVALLLPLSAPNGQVAAQSLRNAAQLAIEDLSGGQNQVQALQIMVKDDLGTPEGAQQAAREAIAAGAELLMGPLFGPSVQAAAGVARAAGKPMIAFSSDASVAQRGVYLLSFLPQADVQRVIDYAASRGKKSFAALVPQSAYGGVVEAEFLSQANRAGRRVTLVERYQPGNKASIDAAIAKIKGAIGQSDTLFLGEGADGIGALTQALSAAGISGQRVQFVSTGIWNDPRVQALPALNGAWFAAPDSARFNALAGRYQQRFGSAPTRIATLAFDAVTLASVLSQKFGSQRFADSTLTNPNGFVGEDGVFRFRQNGVNDRGLAVYEINNGGARVVAPAPTSFAGN